MIQAIEFILYVANQHASKEFYSLILSRTPVLDVPGMTEFELPGGCKLGLMPETGIAKILTPAAPHPADANGIPRCELYIYTTDIISCYQKLIAAGAKEISTIENRNWGDKVCYFSDPDGHIIAFAQKINT